MRCHRSYYRLHQSVIGSVAPHYLAPHYQAPHYHQITD
jgi:hypothetical protein